MSVVVTYPGTALFKYALENQLIKDPVQFVKDSCPTVKLSQMSKEEYAWMLEQILSFQRMPQTFPKDTKSLTIDFEQSCMDLTGTCRSCGSWNEWRNIRLFIAESLTCSNCGRRHYSPIPELVVERVNENVEKLLLKYGKVCFWGINSFFYALCEKLHLDKDRIRCVDKSEIREGINIFGLKVQSPDVIKNERIKCIIVAVPQYYSSIAPMVKLEFPQMKKMLNISELIANNFVLDAEIDREYQEL